MPEAYCFSQVFLNVRGCLRMSAAQFEFISDKTAQNSSMEKNDILCGI